MNERELQRDIEKRVNRKLSPLFHRYGLDFTDLEAILKWKPLVLILGNYSSGKSTLINELVGENIQRTGQAPTDDSFTVITKAPPKLDSRDVPGATLIADENLPFGSFKDYGEQLVSHIEMKYVGCQQLENLAIIDSPGMLDSVTEKDRGYDYKGVIGDLTKLADLVVLMFDPHKAGTIKETYETIRNTLPETAMEDRVVFVMSRIDECDNLGDLVRSYGTLCWNLSQMSGRKDIPRIYLTFSPMAANDPEALGVWVDERNELKRRILAAPELRISHILQDVDKQVNELRLVAEAMLEFSRGARRILKRSLLAATAAGLFAFFFLDVLLREVSGYPAETFLSSLMAGSVQKEQLISPALGAAAGFLLVMAWFAKWLWPRYRKQSMADPDRMVILDTPYLLHSWTRCRDRVLQLMARPGYRELFAGHHGNLTRIKRFIARDLQKYYEKIR